MRVCRYRHGDTVEWGVVVEQDLHRLDGEPFGDAGPGERVADLASVELVAPTTPSKVVCAGRNYRALLAEQERPVPESPFLFLKTPNSVVGPDAPVWYPQGVADVAHEGELAVVIGHPARGLGAGDARKVIFGYTAANDITVRDWQLPNSQWWRAKSADSHCPLGPWVETDLPDPDDIGVRTLVNGEVRQDGRTSDMVFTITELLVHITAHMTLVPGDVVLTGTAAGIRPVQPGDVMEVEVEGIGTLRNPVRVRADGGTT